MFHVNLCINFDKWHSWTLCKSCMIDSNAPVNDTWLNEINKCCLKVLWMFPTNFYIILYQIWLWRLFESLTTIALKLCIKLITNHKIQCYLKVLWMFPMNLYATPCLIKLSKLLESLSTCALKLYIKLIKNHEINVISRLSEYYQWTFTLHFVSSNYWSYPKVY